MPELENISFFKRNIIVKLLSVYKERTMCSEINGYITFALTMQWYKKVTVFGRFLIWLARAQATLGAKWKKCKTPLLALLDFLHLRKIH